MEYIKAFGFGCFLGLAKILAYFWLKLKARLGFISPDTGWAVLKSLFLAPVVWIHLEPLATLASGAPVNLSLPILKLITPALLVSLEPCSGLALEFLEPLEVLSLESGASAGVNF